jgi:hypothetical protein
MGQKQRLNLKNEILVVVVADVVMTVLINIHV